MFCIKYTDMFYQVLFAIYRFDLNSAHFITYKSYSVRIEKLNVNLP